MFTINRMKKIFALTLFLSFFFLAVSPAIALTATSASEGQEKRIEKIASVEARLTARKKEIIMNHFERVTKRLQAAINRLNKLITRIESRLVKIEVNDKTINTKVIKKDLDEAKGQLATVSAKLNEMTTKMETVVGSNTPKESFTEVKSIADKISQILVKVHQILVKVIGDIKGLRVGNSSTPSAVIK